MDELDARARRRILVVDDDDAVCRLVERVLQRAGFVPVATTRPDEALRRFTEERCALAIVDKNLPGVSGIELIAALRQLDAALPAILMTAYPEPLLTGGVRLQGYLAKPFERLQQIVETAQKVLALADELSEARQRSAAAGERRAEPKG